MSNFQQRPMHAPPTSNVPTPGTMSGVPLMPGMPVTMPAMPAFTPFARPPMPPNGLSIIFNLHSCLTIVMQADTDGLNSSFQSFNRISCYSKL